MNDRAEVALERIRLRNSCAAAGHGLLHRNIALREKILQCGSSHLSKKNPTGQAEILPTHTGALFQKAVLRAAELLRAGEPVALPTETVYGLAANAFDEGAVARLFEIKGRPAHNPIIVHVADMEMAGRCTAEWTPEAELLARAFWPGPLTLVLARSGMIPDIVTAGGNTVGVRWPSHPFIQAVIRECGFPLAAPSANLSGGISPTNALHVAKGIGKKIRLIVDGGQAQVGIESTVVDLSAGPARVLRPGIIHAGALNAALSQGGFEMAKLPAPDQKDGTLRSPGMLLKHYSPRAKLEILSWASPADLHRQLSVRHAPLDKIHVIAHTVIPFGESFGGVSLIPHDAEAYARAIYAELHQCDEAGAEEIIVEALPVSNEWQAVADRLKRAAIR
jgi:L-threonylcarbamoyladenylate synthase